jgi:hypothetical protein
MKPKHRHSLRDGVNGLYRARPGETGFCVTVAQRISARRARRADVVRSASLAPATRAPGPHAFAVRSRIARLTMRSRPSHPASTFGDDWPYAPLQSRRDAPINASIFRKTEDRYFSPKQKFCLTWRFTVEQANHFEKPGSSAKPFAFANPADLCKVQTASPIDRPQSARRTSRGWNS